jgi:hypothetical protein
MIQPLRVEKDRMGVVIYTQHLRVEGYLHLRPGSRLTDFLDLAAAGNFMAVTDAKVYSWAEGTPLYQADVIDVNRNFIVMVIPKGPAGTE